MNREEQINEINKKLEAFLLKNETHIYDVSSIDDEQEKLDMSAKIIKWKSSRGEITIIMSATRKNNGSIDTIKSAIVCKNQEVLKYLDREENSNKQQSPVSVFDSSTSPSPSPKTTTSQQLSPESRQNGMSRGGDDTPPCETIG